jgi:cell division protease FtsH
MTGSASPYSDRPIEQSAMENASLPVSSVPESASGEPKTKSSAGASAPWWLWALLITGFALMFWVFRPETSVAVTYNPWFLDQVESDNIKSLVIRDTEIRGELRRDQPFWAGASLASVPVRKFTAYFPSQHSIEPVIKLLRERNQSTEPVQIQTTPPSSERAWMWLVLLVQTLLILMVLFRVGSLQARLPK